MISALTGVSIQLVNHMGEDDKLKISASDLQRTDNLLSELDEAKKRNRRAVEIVHGFKSSKISQEAEQGKARREDQDNQSTHRRGN